MSIGENSLVAAYQGKGQLKSRPSGSRVGTVIIRPIDQLGNALSSIISMHNLSPLAFWQPDLSLPTDYSLENPSDLTHSLTLWKPDLSLPRTIIWKTPLIRRSARE